jgi:hypothetical protein
MLYAMMPRPSSTGTQVSAPPRLKSKIQGAAMSAAPTR